MIDLPNNHELIRWLFLPSGTFYKNENVGQVGSDSTVVRPVLRECLPIVHNFLRRLYLLCLNGIEEQTNDIKINKA